MIVRYLQIISPQSPGYKKSNHVIQMYPVASIT